MIRQISLSILTITLSLVSTAQTCTPLSVTSNPDSIFAKLGANKKFDSSLFEPALLALKYYPELQDVEIEFRRKRLATLMAARPTAGFIFSKKEKRRYIVYIGINAENRCRKIIRNMNCSAKTGIIGHEYAHILSYTQKSNLQMLLFAIRYPFSKKKVERETDRLAIERGLGPQMIDFNRHIWHSEFASKQYLRRKSRYYLSLAEIESAVSGSF